jgi:gluconate 2-dehydrogenase gamma chain
MTGPDAVTKPLLADQLATLDAIIARLIPADELGPGAREANVLRYITRSLAADYEQHLAAYSTGLAMIEDRADALHGVGFVQLSSPEQDAILVEAERGQTPGFTASSDFVELVREHTLEGMFGDPKWGGNADKIGWKLIGYPGPRHTWSAYEQRIERVDHRS